MPEANATHRLENSFHQPPPGTKKLGPADPNEVLPVTITVRRRPGSPSLPDQEHWASTPPGERRFLSSEEFEERYGADPEDLEQVAHFVRERGLTLVDTNPSQRTVVASGTVANLSKAFAVEFARYETEDITEKPRRPVRLPEKAPGKQKKQEDAEKTIYVGFEGYVHIPEQLENVVEGVFGLDRRRLARRAIVPFPTITPLTPPQVAKLYDFPATPPHMHKETIGLLEFSNPMFGTCGYYPSDVTSFFTTPLGIGPGYTPPGLTDIGVNGASNAPGGPDDIEVALDIQVAGAAAQGAHINVYFTTWDENGWILAVKRAVHPKPGERRPSVLSISWAWSEFDTIGGLTWTKAVMDAVSTTFQEAAMFGITVFAASGDYGSSAGIGGATAHVAYPESDPWVTSVGGTTIGNVSGSSFTEVTWVASGVVEFGTTGGGVSDAFHLPFWQHHHNIPLSVNPGHHRGRGVPDIAGYASGYTIVYSGAQVTDVQGTSEAAPLYAGLIALINGHLGERVGYLNPTLYSHRLQHCFRDIADGRNNSDLGAPGYTSVPGWDACTGLGSVKGHALLKALEHHRLEVHAFHGEESFTGKVAGLVFDRFGEFEGFLLAEMHGGERKFDSRAKEVQQVVGRAWSEHVTTTVTVRDKEAHDPIAIILRDHS
ncbi:MAG: S53 family peptidase [Acidobacteriaceae bacterium]